MLTGALTDVTDGETLLGVSTGGQSTGVAEGRYSAADGFQLIATFDGLPAPLPGTFYEGWLVDSESGNFISTGELFQDADGRFVNEFSDAEDLRDDYDNYVLTIEPDDGDPAPADHVLEGRLTLV